MPVPSKGSLLSQAALPSEEIEAPRSQQPQSSETGRRKQGTKGIPALRPTALPYASGKESAISRSGQDTQRQEASRFEDNDDDDTPDFSAGYSSETRDDLAHGERDSTRMQLLEDQEARSKSMHYLMKKVKAFDAVERSEAGKEGSQRG